MQTIYGFNSRVWGALEEAVTPLPRGSNNSRIMHALPAAYLLPGAMITGSVAAAAGVASYAASCFSSAEEVDPRNDFRAVCKDSRLWPKLEPFELSLGRDDPNFLFGTATSTFQDSGAVNCPDSQWADWEMRRVPEARRSEQSANLFELYKTEAGRKEIIERLQKIGANSYRFSVEWSQIQPKENLFLEEVLAVYVDLCKDLRDHGIQPMVTLHHFSEPKWFHAQGSFEREENIASFVTFSQRVFGPFVQNYRGKPLVEYFCTINEPTVEASLRNITGEFSPGGYMRFERAAIFLKNMLKAHVRVYEALKPMKPEVMIGIVHQPFANVPANPVVSPLVRYINRYTNEAASNFFKTGKFELKIPFFCNVVEEGLNPKTDLVYLQYYARPVLGFFGPTSFHEPMTMMPWREDPEGLFEAIIEAHRSFKAPVMITENGISTNDDAQRERYMSRALYAAEKAQEVIGKENLKGYFVWSFCDNTEWTFGIGTQNFGAYATERFNGRRVLAKEPKPGLAPFIKAARAWQLTHRK